MSWFARLFLLVAAPLLAVLLALLGAATLATNPLGWFLLLVGTTYVVGMLFVFLFRKKRFAELAGSGTAAQAERSDRSFWFITLGMTAAFYLSPYEYLCLSPGLPRSTWITLVGLILVVLAGLLFVSARRALGAQYSGHISVRKDHILVQNGPYRFIRHPAYASFLLMALGISLGYSSWMGLASVVVLLMGFIYRIQMEEKLLTEYFGEAYRQYMLQTKRLIPGLW